MSVQHGRLQRHLLAPERAMHRFQYTEGRAMSPVPARPSVGRALIALILVAMAGGMSTYGILLDEKKIVWSGLSVLCLVFLWMLCRLSL